MIGLIKNTLLDILFPPLCISCNAYLGKESKRGLVCQSCLGAVPIYDSLFCPICLRRVPEKNHCHPQAGYLLAPVTHYDNPSVKKLIFKLKYGSWLQTVEPLQELLVNYLKKLPVNGKGFVVIPIPLHPDRELHRGFNQSNILASKVSRHLDIELIKNNLIRVKNTKSQTEFKDYKAREQNLACAFHLNRPERLRNKSIILVDDVFTSGATINEAVRTLKAAGVRKIVALILARAR